ncbi:hypothetical protein NC796_04045 [Aliifodinibius sp. S!AR15-10]|uniref:hypothetical protein n=1 Tax=Aliifodinibius sp. S!AR15-10 TaxID=2950437 RepID=UPI00285A6E16|nr:hypothetical protein [Aliifodinibius sp. S!AR15-10]MDR8390299.1 hypothetical protein [Aliifodinibius sp. S!AR15-10]
MKYLNKNKLLQLLPILLLCFVGSNVVQAQQTSVDELIQRANENGIDQTALAELRTRAQNRGMGEEQLFNIIEPAVSLSQENLPADHIIQKALEGLSKGVPDNQIASVINRMKSSTQQAAQVVDPWMQNPAVQKMVERSDGPENSQRVRNRMIEASSKAISQNIPSESVNQILTEIGDESILSEKASSDIIAAINILPDIAAGGQPGVAQAFVVRALKGGFNSEELLKLPMAVNMAQKRNQLPAAGVLEGASQQLQNGTPASQVLQNLFNGNVGGGPPGNVPKGLQDNPGQGKGQGQGQGGRGQGRGNN